MQTLGSCRHDVPRLRVCSVLVPSAETAGLEQVLPHTILPQCHVLVPSAETAWLEQVLTLAQVACLCRILTKLGWNRFCTTKVSWGVACLSRTLKKLGIEKQVLPHPRLAYVAWLCRILTKLGWNRFCTNQVFLSV